ncbi:MAG: hypothetical protein OXC81_04435 [Betaproteobacteria bacterium]|nr:hypothetical protein [Betaproteobacteria bacterium]
MLLGSIGLGGVTLALFTSPLKTPLFALGNFEIAHWMATAVLGLIFLAGAIKTFTGSGKSTPVRKAAPAPAKAARPAAAKKTETEAAPEASPSPAGADAAPAAEATSTKPMVSPEEQTQGPDDDDDGMSLEIKQKVKRLVNLEQKTITNDIARELVIEYYPELAELIYRIDDPKSLETFTRHIIGIARIRLKLSDKHLADDQFSNFQRRLFDAENDEVLKMYAPKDQGSMSEAQKPFYGKAVDERHWEKMQRTLRAEGDDWRGISVKNAKSILSETGKRR